MSQARVQSGRKKIVLTETPQNTDSNQLQCPECGSTIIVKAGHKTFSDGSDNQRYKCKVCHFRFTLGKDLIDFHDNFESSRLSVILEETKKLASTTETKTVGDNQKEVSVEAQIVNYLLKLKSKGRRESTLEARDWQIRRLISLGANLNDPENVKKVIADLNRSESYKVLLCIAYEEYLTANGKTWQRPEYKQSENLPFVPHESELNDLIAGCNTKTAAFLRLLTETAMRPGEAWLAEWIHFDPEHRTFVCKNPEKNSRPRAFDDLTPELCQMLAALPHNSQFIFTTRKQPNDIKEERKIHMRYFKRQKSILGMQRARVAAKLKNPRIAEISYCTCRHWKATELYHKTKDILYVMKFLGHRSIKNTLVYIDLERISYPKDGDCYTGRVAKTTSEKLELIEAGFEFVSMDPDGTQYFRKRR